MKVGDEVRIKDGVYAGQTATVTEIHSSHTVRIDKYDKNPEGYIKQIESLEPLTPENQSGRFKVGTKVKILVKYRDGRSDLNGEIADYGTVTRNNPGASFCDVTCDNGINYSYRFEDLKLITEESTMPTYKDDKYEYTALKSLSPKSLLDASPCNLEFDKYCRKFGYHNEPVLEDVIRACADNSAWLPWLKSHGYVRVEEIEEEMKFERGDIFNIEGTRVMFSRVGDNSFGLIVLDGTFKGSIWSVDQKHYADKLNTEGFKKALGYQSKDYKMIYKTRNKGI